MPHSGRPEYDWQHAFGRVEKASGSTCTVAFDYTERSPVRHLSLCVEGLRPSRGDRCIFFFAGIGLRSLPLMFVWKKHRPHEITITRCSEN